MYILKIWSFLNTYFLFSDQFTKVQVFWRFDLFWMLHIFHFKTSPPIKERYFEDLIYLNTYFLFLDQSTKLNKYFADLIPKVFFEYKILTLEFMISGSELWFEDYLKLASKLIHITSDSPHATVFALPTSVTWYGLTFYSGWRRCTFK